MSSGTCSLLGGVKAPRLVLGKWPKVAPGVFFVYGTIYPKHSELNRNRTVILERNHFRWAGYTPIVAAWIADVPLGVLALLVGYSTLKTYPLMRPFCGP